MPLPPPSKEQPNWAKVRDDIAFAMTNSKAITGVLAADSYSGQRNLGAQFATLAWQCASTYRATDFAGGCNGARIRFPPQKAWPANVGLVDAVIATLRPVKDAHPQSTWADLIVLAGTVGVAQAAGIKPEQGQIVGKPFSFCPGRTDAANGAGSESLAPRNYSSPEIAFKDNAAVQGLTGREAVALAARPRR